MSSAASQQGLLRKTPVAASTPANVKASSSPGHKTNLAVLKATASEAASSAVTDNEVADSGQLKVCLGLHPHTVYEFPAVSASPAALVRNEAQADFARRSETAAKAPGVSDG